MKHRLFALTMKTVVKCECGATIDIAGATPRKDGIKVWCRVCGTVTVITVEAVTPSHGNIGMFMVVPQSPIEK